jgi:membrane-associated protein
MITGGRADCRWWGGAPGGVRHRVVPCRDDRTGSLSDGRRTARPGRRGSGLMSQWLNQLTDLGQLTTTAVYVVVIGLVFVESGLLVGFFLPGDSVLFTAGLLAAEPGSGLRVELLSAAVFVAAVAGDAVGYWTGRRFGRPWLLRRAGRAARHVESAERFYARYGWWAVVVARFIPWVRTFTPIVAGVARMPYPRFLSANLVGAGVWGSGLVLLGYAGHSMPWVRWTAYAVAGVAILISVVAPIVGWLRTRRRRRLSAAQARNRADGRTAPRAPDAPRRP